MLFDININNMTNRRIFLKQAGVAGIAATLSSPLSAQVPGREMIWANLLHLSYNMWEDSTNPKYMDDNYKCTTCQEAREWAHGYRSMLTFDEPVWNALLKEMARVGMNMVIIDLGDGVQYESHPEIAVKNAWSVKKLRAELAKARKLGLEPIPKLNFSTCHDTWLKDYSRMISTDKYYAVCKDLIKEVSGIFDKPRFFHLGMDEETAANQAGQNYAVLRQHDLWWNDLYLFIDEVEKNGIRSWVWSDYGWHNPDLFFKKMPKAVLQSNWYYGSGFDLNNLQEPNKTYLKFYDDLEKYGYDQVPTGSNHSVSTNFESTVDYCKKIINPARLYGFMQTPWRPTLAPCLDRHKEAIAQVGNAIKKWS
jgi:hypothetical protein